MVGFFIIRSQRGISLHYASLRGIKEERVQKMSDFTPFRGITEEYSASLREGDVLNRYFSACSTSLRISSLCSRPTAIRIKPGEMPTASRSSSVSLE